MPCPHMEINIVKRAEGQSAVNAAAYQTGEKLYSERDRRYMYNGTKEELIMREILLPPHAPPEFADRKTLWNSVEAAEKNWNSQLARRMKITLPKDLSMEDNIALAKEYCQKEFVSKGMISTGRFTSAKACTRRGIRQNLRNGTGATDLYGQGSRTVNVTCGPSPTSTAGCLLKWN